LDKVAKELGTNPAAYGLDSALRCAHFFAQVRQESGEALKPCVESLNYAPAALIAHFGYYKQHQAEAATDGYEKNAAGKIVRRALEENIANKAYGGRADLGNTGIASGDGWSFRGRGFIQVTGRANYAEVTRQCKLLYPNMDVDYVANPDLMAASPGAERSAVGYWIMKGLHKIADMGATGADVDRITAVINKHTDSYPARRANFVIAFNALIN
jgi:putative chitinase